MGGSVLSSLFMQQPEQQQQFTPAQYNNQQMLDYAKQNKGSVDMSNQYKDAIKDQLRNGSYKDPYQVWAQVRNNNDRNAFNQAQQQQMLQSGGDSTAAGSDFYSG